MLIVVGVIDGLLIGYCMIFVEWDGKGCCMLIEVELWEVLLVIFFMLVEVKVGKKFDCSFEMVVVFCVVIMVLCVE